MKFHAFSQVAALLLTPTNALVVLVLSGVLLGFIKRTAVFGRRVALLAAAILSLLALPPIGGWLLKPLETRFPPFAPDGAPVAGIIVLGGSISTGATPRGPHPEPNEAADRIFEAARLARVFAGAPVLISGGPLDPVTRASEADLVAGYMIALGVPRARILEERSSKDTFENARFSAALVHPRPGQRWLLVSSAIHMPRAVACFRSAGFTLVAAPADWRRGLPSKRWSWSASGNLASVDLAWKEYLGLAAYRLSGRTSELFPRP